MVGRKCNHCQEFKVWEDFAVNKKGLNDRKSICKVCSNNSQKALAKQRREAEPEKYKLKRWEKHVARAYSMTLEQVEELLESQNRQCAICSRVGNPTSKKNQLFIDHCHSTGKVRGMLCYSCNTLLGFSFDKIEILTSAIDYLKKSTLNKKELAK